LIGSRHTGGGGNESSPLLIDDPSAMVVGYAQWQGAGLEYADRYKAGGERMYRSVRSLLPLASHPEVTVATDEPGSAARLAKNVQWWGATVIQRQQAATAEMLRRVGPERVVTVGGDCGVSPSSVGYLEERYGGSMAVLWLDAHAGLDEPNSSPSGLFHGMALRACLEPAAFAMERVVPVPLLPGQTILAGTRSIDGPEQRFLLEKGMVNLPPASLDHSGGGSDRGRSALADALEHISVLQQWRGAKHL